MALKIARGFFRLWIIFSVLWIGGVAVNAWLTLPVDQQVSPQPTNSDDFQPDEFLAYYACKDAGNSDDQCAAMMKGPNKYLAYQRCLYHGHDDQCAVILKAPIFDPFQPFVIVRDSERRAAVGFATLLALVPPSFLLSFGSALVWAFRGFRS
jgi:hypothetical protein